MLSLRALIHHRAAKQLPKQDGAAWRELQASSEGKYAANWHFSGRNDSPKGDVRMTLAGGKNISRCYRQAFFIFLAAHQHALFLVRLEHEMCRGGDDTLDRGELFRDKGCNLAQVFALDHHEQIVAAGHE